MPLNLSTSAKITWCPGCPNNQILVSFRKAVTELVDSGAWKPEHFVAAAGIGCHGKITDYLNMNTFECLHGRAIPTATGIRLANPSLNVVVFSGDGDAYSEGMNHLIHAAQRNPDITVFIHDNQVFALTTGQATATSPTGYKGNSRPEGSIDVPLKPLEILLAAGASFIARTYAGDMAKTTEIMKAAMCHKGFAFVDIIQPCITFYDTRDFYKEHIVWLAEDHDVSNPDAAFRAMRRADDKIPLGIFYRSERPTFEELI